MPNRSGTMAYALPFNELDYRPCPPSFYGPSPMPTWYGPPPAWRKAPGETGEQFIQIPQTLASFGLSPEDRELLKRIDEKLDELLKKESPAAEQVAEIRRRVREALGEKP
jgi:hypothetical protein